MNLRCNSGRRHWSHSQSLPEPPAGNFATGWYNSYWSVVKRLEPGEPGWQLEQHRQELPVVEPQQEQPDEPEQQPGLSRGPSSAGKWMLPQTEPTADPSCSARESAGKPNSRPALVAMANPPGGFCYILDVPVCVLKEALSDSSGVRSDVLSIF